MTEMADKIRGIYDKPESGGIYYSANSARTGSDRLNAMPHWDWTPTPSHWAGAATTCMFPQALGCEPTEVDGHPWIKQLITDPAQVRDIEPVNPYIGWPGDSIDFAVIAREFGGKAVIAPHVVIDMHKEKGALTWGRDFEDEFDFFRYMVESMPDNAAMNVWFSNIVQKGDIMENIYDYLHALGHSPQAQNIEG